MLPLNAGEKAECGPVDQTCVEGDTKTGDIILESTEHIQVCETGPTEHRIELLFKWQTVDFVTISDSLVFSMIQMA